MHRLKISRSPPEIRYRYACCVSSTDIFLFFSLLLSPVGWLQLESFAPSYTVSIRKPAKGSFLTWTQQHFTTQYHERRGV